MSRFRCLAAAAVTMLAALPLAGQVCDPNPYEPYVFILFDTSGSMNWSPPCSQARFDAAQCSPLCPTGDCFVPLQGDDPGSKLYQMKEAVQTAVAGQTGIQFGFASFNQDQLYARAKHWVYAATSNGPIIPGWGPYPAAGALEVFGLDWPCDTGNLDNEIGCYTTRPADLSDVWERTRIQRLPKGGMAFTTPVSFFTRHAGIIYKVTYTPVPGSTLGGPSLSVTVKTAKCANSACTSTTFVGQTTTSWSRSAEFLSWDNASSSNPSRTNPQLSYFTSTVMDASAGNTCAGWDPNTDSVADSSGGYTLRFATNSSDPRGAALYTGDVLPWDWMADHNAEIQARLAPNLIFNPAATPDFGISRYLNNTRSGADSFLRLRNEWERPLIATGSTPLGSSLESFRTWYTAWKEIAAVNDPDWACRRKALILVTDGDSTCTDDPCPTAASLFSEDGISVFVVGFGTALQSYHPQLSCIATSGGTGAPSLPETKQELIALLNAIFAAATAP
jgi:hypothetical protein